MSAPTPLQRLLAAVPAVMLVALAASVAGDVAISLYQSYVSSLDDRSAAGWTRSSLLSTVIWVTITIVTAIGLGAAARRAPVRDRDLVIAAAVLVGVAALRAVFSVYLHYLASPSRDLMEASYLWGARVSCLAWVGASICLTLAMRRGRDPALVVGLGAVLVLTALVAHPPRMAYEWLYFDWSQETERRNLALGFLYRTAHTGALLLALFELGRHATPEEPRVRRVAEGIARVGTALVARIVIGAGFAFLMLLAIGAKSPGLVKATFVLVPGAVFCAMVAMVSGMFQAGDAGGAPRPPRFRFALAGTLSLASLVMTAIQAIAVYRTMGPVDGSGELSRREHLELVALAFPYLGPAITLAGFLFLISALASLRAQRGPVLGSADPATAAALLVTCSIAAVGLHRYMRELRDQPGTFLVLLIAVIVANIIAQLAVARLCHKVADGLVADGDSALPPARIHEPE